MNENSVTPTQVTANPTVAPTATPEPTVTVAPTVVPVEEIDYTGKKLVALTFDDGPNLTITPFVLDKLEEYGVVASFFLIGQYIDEETKPVMERELSLGCEICNHSWTHSYMNELTTDEIKKEIRDTSNLIYEMVGVTPKFFRPPYIVTSTEMYDNIDLPFINGINCADWDESVTAEKRVELILNNVKDGDIILLHDFDGNQNTVDALDAIIQGLKDDEYELVTVNKLFELKGVEPNIANKIWSNTSC
jgi:peptidoglycan/xylan/chitin deacetylase (PgdA/CDA1 family)